MRSAKGRTFADSALSRSDLELVCPQCGQANIPSKKFCNKYGVSLVKASPTTSNPEENPIERVAKAVFVVVRMAA